MAHEFNNIHSIVLGYLELSLSFGEIDDKVRMYLEHVMQAVQRAAAVTRNLLSFASKPRSDRTNACLNDIVKNTLEIIRREYQSEGIAISYEPGKLPLMEMNESLLGQVVFNLLMNARHALTSRERKEIAVRTWARDGSVFMAVTDTGCGIPAENLSKIFTPFFTTKGEFSAGDSAMAQVKGTGLGLSVCHNIVASHEGEISVESDVGVGTTFTVRLPVRAHESQNAAAGIDAETASLARGGRVLIMDDEKDILNILGDGLRARGLVVTECEEGARALEIIGREKVDLVLTDLQMPSMEGMEFLRRLKQMPQEDKPQVLILTGKPVADEKREELLGSLGADEILSKPFRLNDIQAKICRAIAGRRLAAK